MTIASFPIVLDWTIASFPGFSIAIQRSASSYPFFPSLPQFFRFRLIVKLFFFLSPLYLPFPTLFHFPSTTISFLSFFFDRSFLPSLQRILPHIYSFEPRLFTFHPFISHTRSKKEEEIVQNKSSTPLVSIAKKLSPISVSRKNPASRFSKGKRIDPDSSPRTLPHR